MNRAARGNVQESSALYRGRSMPNCKYVLLKYSGTICTSPNWRATWLPGSPRISNVSRLVLFNVRLNLVIWGEMAIRSAPRVLNFSIWLCRASSSKLQYGHHIRQALLVSSSEISILVENMRVFCKIDCLKIYARPVLSQYSKVRPSSMKLLASLWRATQRLISAIGNL